MGRGVNFRAISPAVGFAYNYFRENPPNWETNCDLYAWYYYSQAFFQEGGKEWKQWNSTAMAAVLANQNPDGTWKPEGTSKHHAWGAAAAGVDAELYRTSLCALILEVYYRYLKIGS
jgi:hypothetical protein